MSGSMRVELVGGPKDGEQWSVTEPLPWVMLFPPKRTERTEQEIVHRYRLWGDRTYRYEGCR